MVFSVFKSLKIELNLDTSNNEALKEFLGSMNLDEEFFKTIEQKIKGLIKWWGIEGLSDILKLFDGRISLLAGVEKATIELAIEINGIKDFLTVA